MRALGFIVVFCVAVTIALILNKSQMMKVGDLTQESIITLTAPPKTGPIHGITLRIYGNIKGSATLSIGHHPAQTIAGSFELKHKGDWYEPTCKIQYKPIGATSGSMTIEYEFRD